MASRKNKWRSRGRLQFKRETKRYSDGTPWGHDILFVRVRKQDCALVEPWTEIFPAGHEHHNPARRVSVLPSLGSTYRIISAVQAAKLIRASLRGLGE